MAEEVLEEAKCGGDLRNSGISITRTSRQASIHVLNIPEYKFGEHRTAGCLVKSTGYEIELRQVWTELQIQAWGGRGGTCCWLCRVVRPKRVAWESIISFISTNPLCLRI